MNVGQLKRQIDQAGLSNEDEAVFDTEEGRYGIAEIMTEDNVLLIVAGDYIEED